MPLANITPTGELRLRSSLAGAAAVSRRLGEAGWCSVLNADGDVFELVARRRSPTIADALEELLSLRACGTVYLDSPDESHTLSTAELRVCAYPDDETVEQ
jgi:hypothetical protein